MNLRETVDALESLDIAIALDIGVHGGCEIDSNCPLAVELRRIIGESGISFADLIGAYANLTPSVPEPVSLDIPETDGKISVSIAGVTKEYDLTDYLNTQVNSKFLDKIRELENGKTRLESAGRSLFNSYLNAIQEQKRIKVLEQLSYPAKELIKSGCMITREENRYLFIFPKQYHPRYIVRNGTRYQISTAHENQLWQPIYIQIAVNSMRRIESIYTLNKRGDKLIHYHGRQGDCWGTMRTELLNSPWDGSLTQLANIAHNLEGALGTVNYDSPMERNPSGMPSLPDLFEAATRLGEEGVRREGNTTATPEDTIEAPTPRRRTWGRREE